MQKYHVIAMVQDAGPETPSTIIEARNPESAARLALGETLARGSQRGNNTLRAKVYWTGADGALNLVKLYPSA